MVGRIPEDVIADVRERTDIVQVIGQHVELKRSGGNHKGLCPFHDEKTPSFNVNGPRQFYHCFGCGESGDVFSFLMKLEGRRFGEVVEDLAGRAGVEIKRSGTAEDARVAARRRSERQRALDLNGKVLRLYRKILGGQSGAAARAYLERRAIGNDVCEAFQLGYAPASGDVLVRKFQQHEVSMEFAEQLGLVARRRDRPGYHDRFWDRLIFPLVAAGGEVLGFGGRRISDGDGPKYINTPETSLYRKGESLYGLSVAASAMRRTQTAILVEGNFDVLQLHQWGFDNAVAPMGTALTEGQTRLLRRFAPRVVAVFDGDDAGRAAARRAVPVMVAAGVEGRVATLPLGEDPDSLLKSQGPGKLSEIIEKSVPAIDHLIAELQDSLDDSIPARARILEQVAPVIRQLDSAVARDLYIDRLAMSLDVGREVAQRAVTGGRTQGAVAQSSRAEPAASDPADETVDPHEVDPLAILVEHPHLCPRAEQAEVVQLLTSELLRATYSAAAEMQRETGKIDVGALLQAAHPRIRGAVAAVVLSGRYASDGDPTRALDDCIASLQRRRVDSELTRVKSEMARAESRGDAAALDQLRQRLVELIQERRQIHETR